MRLQICLQLRSCLLYIFASGLSFRLRCLTKVDKSMTELHQQRWTGALLPSLSMHSTRGELEGRTVHIDAIIIEIAGSLQHLHPECVDSLRQWLGDFGCRDDDLYLLLLLLLVILGHR